MTLNEVRKELYNEGYEEQELELLCDNLLEDGLLSQRGAENLLNLYGCKVTKKGEYKND
jgi:hypothetical protein